MLRRPAEPLTKLHFWLHYPHGTKDKQNGKESWDTPQHKSDQIRVEIRLYVPRADAEKVELIQQCQNGKRHEHRSTGVMLLMLVVERAKQRPPDGVPSCFATTLIQAASA